MERGSGRRRWGRWLLASGLLVAAACGGEAADSADEGTRTAPATAPAGAVTLPLAERALDDPDVTSVATDLAPSQTGGSTVAEPPSPDPCRARDVEMWTAQVGPAADTAVIRMRNVSDTWCEPDIGRSPLLDPAIEPDVWLLPDGTADLVVGPDGSECADPQVVDRVQVGIGEESALVPSALVTCGWWLTAFYPNDAVQDACDVSDLDIVAAATTVVVRNASTKPCGIGGLVDVEGAAVVADATPPAPAVTELLPGDVVSFGAAGDACEGVRDLVVLTDEIVGELRVREVPCDVEFELGAARPWFGSATGPLARFPDGAVAETADLVAALDPFGEGE